MTHKQLSITNVFIFVQAVLYILTGVWVLRTSNAGWNLLFSVFCEKKLSKKKLKKAEKAEKWGKIYQKNGFLEFAPKRWLRVLLPEIKLD